jgi:glutamate-1-semialdehyde 2,1-aminomutase
VNFQRPAALELEAAQTFLDAVGTDMVKFAKHGSSVTTAAVKLARAYTGRRKVAIVKEQPFFSFDDWFIGVTPVDFGIPDELKAFTLRFSYNDLDSLETLFRNDPDDIACVMLEAVKFDAPVPGFLEGVRALCDRYGAVFVLDEMVTGFRFGVPGAAKRFGIEADLYTFGKGISNGFPATAITGRRDIMELGGIRREGGRKLFLLSTTHGSESSGLAAMIATLNILRDGSVLAANERFGERLRSALQSVIARHGLSEYLQISGYPCLLLLETRGVDGKPDLAFRTLFLQEAIAAGLLFQGLFLPTPSHGEAEFAQTVQAFERACPVYKAALESGSVNGYLVGPAIKPVFRPTI